MSDYRSQREVASGRLEPMTQDDRFYDAMRARDPRFDGTIFVAVKTTGIYCRPSCPTPIHPKRVNVSFHRTAASAQRAGYRACKRCRPDASPGSPEWNVRGDLVGRAMRHIVDGLVDREGVGGVARALAVSERHLHRILVEEVGAGPLELARSQRAQTARLLIETTDLSSSDVAFAAGFSSIRQFHDTVRAVFDASPTELRAKRSRGTRHGGEHANLTPPITIRLRARTPFDGQGLLRFLAARAVRGVEVVDPTTNSYARTLRLPNGSGTVECVLGDEAVLATFRLTDLSDLGTATSRVRRLFDLDTDSFAIDAHLSSDPALRSLVEACSGRRVPGTVDAHEIAVRAVLGQQVSVAGARRTAGRLTEEFGERVDFGVPGLTNLFPSAAALYDAGPDQIPVPRSRAEALTSLCGSLASGDLDLSIGADRAKVRAQMIDHRGIGPWTADYVLIRALREPDGFLPSDLGVKHAALKLGLPTEPRPLAARAERWAPWRSSALFHLWSLLP